MVYTELFIGDGGQKGNGWHKWYEAIKGVLSDIGFGELPFCREYLWSRKKFRCHDIPLHGMDMRGEEQIIALGIFLPVHRSWFYFVGFFGSLLHLIIKSPCSDVLVELARSEGCGSRVLDNWGDIRLDVVCLPTDVWQTVLIQPLQLVQEWDRS